MNQEVAFDDHFQYVYFIFLPRSCDMLLKFICSHQDNYLHACLSTCMFLHNPWVSEFFSDREVLNQEIIPKVNEVI